MLDKFPGLLGYGGIIAIHADWPIYPRGVGWKIALKSIGNFPKGTLFYEIDDIDKCKLLINHQPDKLSDPFHYQHYHIAVWHEDLIELGHKGFVEGVIPKSDYEFKMYQYENFRKLIGDNLNLDKQGNINLYLQDDKGKSIPTKYHKPVYDEEDEDDFAFRSWVVISNYICLTDKGIEELNNISNEINLTSQLTGLTQPLIEISRFDTAVRDAALLLETKIKEYHRRSDLYGQKLIDFHINEVIKRNNTFNSAEIKYYRGELRTIFKFIRNEFAHNFKVLTKEQCKMILSRISDALSEFDEVINAYFDNDST